MTITGAGGQLGSELVRVFAELGDEVIGLRRPEFDLTRAADLERLVAARPEVVINAAAWTDVDGCALDPPRALRINGEAAGRAAEAAERAGALIVQVSTNEVFDGERERPYEEDDPPAPINSYGASKLAGERAVAAAAARHLIVRTAWIYGGPSGFPVKIRAAAERARENGQPLRVVADEFGNPTPADQLAARIAAVLHLCDELGPPRVIHLAGVPPASRYEWAQRVVGEGVSLDPISQRDYQRPSRPPRRAVLATGLAAERGVPPISWLDRPG